MVLVGFIQLRIGSCEHGNETSRSIKGEDFLDQLSVLAPEEDSILLSLFTDLLIISTLANYLAQKMASQRINARHRILL